MRLYSFNDFKYICYVEGKRKGAEKLFTELLEIKKLKAFCRKVDKKDIDLNTIYQEYLDNYDLGNNQA
ncbi:hypothetical protein [Listeria monocytogenes]|uniref:hypothetical protein n=1 Tax=Listeria monocytogenes TaxID=1639 RepID=UPI0011EA8BBD|nr:hypothetical protein [Listeria monocytogenes]EHC5262353.1 hypothetical protein [Listeria monocytogenes serotype 1/2a]EAE6286567.1 hypothetical protein [Listeria monocytogenes]EID2624590.1 hypothetical protein [Listeria monocytogenes]EJQ3350852.1 hypothetical protein [Listeria monocytogenes]ELC6642856.1 hypothetical protein [Listeria monocytogenes]